MSNVIIRKARYETGLIRPAVHEMLAAVAARVTPGSRVLIKPNFLRSAAVEHAMLTHPLVVRSVAESLLDMGARVQVGDSPAIGNFHKLIEIGGYKEALGGLGVTLEALHQSVPVDVGEPFGTIELAREALEADLVINLPKLKTHTQMVLTLGVKNMFGCVVGLRKAEWHMRMGVDRLQFARLLVRIYETVAPAYTLVDGITALEGQGPGRGGTPRELGLLIGGTSAHAVDKTICTMLGLAPDSLPTLEQARALGVFDGEVHVNGDLTIIDDFAFPRLHSLTLGPETFGRFMRRFVIQRPVVDDPLCRACGECWKICPAKAVSRLHDGVAIDTECCIRCYCCLEVCPQGAIRAREPLLGRIWRRHTRG